MLIGENLTDRTNLSDALTGGFLVAWVNQVSIQGNLTGAC